ncbi:PKD domain-containing protein [Algivirga pacifica]
MNYKGIKLLSLLLLFTFVVSAQSKDKGIKLKQVYPDQVEGEEIVIEYSSPSESILQFDLVNAMSGEKIQSGSLAVRSGEQVQVFEIGVLPAGDYQLSVKGDNTHEAIAFQKVTARGEASPMSVNIIAEGSTTNEGYHTVRKEITFEAEVSEAADQVIWDFGDGAVSKEASTTHAFQYPGEFEVTLIVLNGGRVYTSKQQVVVVR